MTIDDNRIHFLTFDIDGSVCSFIWIPSTTQGCAVTAMNVRVEHAVVGIAALWVHANTQPVSRWSLTLSEVLFSFRAWKARPGTRSGLFCVRHISSNHTYRP